MFDIAMMLQWVGKYDNKHNSKSYSRRSIPNHHDSRANFAQCIGDRFGGGHLSGNNFHSRADFDIFAKNAYHAFDNSTFGRDNVFKPFAIHHKAFFCNSFYGKMTER